MKEYVLRNARVVTPTTVMHVHVLVRDGLVADVDEGDIPAHCRPGMHRLRR